MLNLANSRFNPKPGILDFWNEFRKPNPYRWPILAVSMIPFAIILWWLVGETVYKDPEKPKITYIETLSEDRSDAEIIASNKANQEVKELREADAEARAERKRDMYKALGRASGMDVNSIDERGKAERAKQEAAEKKRLEEMMDRVGAAPNGAAKPNDGNTP
jgi:hypothetical protein